MKKGYYIVEKILPGNSIFRRREFLSDICCGDTWVASTKAFTVKGALRKGAMVLTEQDEDFTSHVRKRWSWKADRVYLTAEEYKYYDKRGV